MMYPVNVEPSVVLHHVMTFEPSVVLDALGM
jgi:hypothetical protein